MIDQFKSNGRLPYLTHQFQGVGGTIKESPEDFIVEEIPSYHPCGSGGHCYLTIEKRGITTLEAIRRIAQALKIQERDIGYAGMKDAAGITRQTISVQRVAPEIALALNLDCIRVTAAAQHTNKLKLGHLKGNRFCIAVRGISDSASRHVPEIMDILAARGVPNYFGLQRYGVQGNSHIIGLAMLKRDWQEAVNCLIGESDAVRDEVWSSAISAYRDGDTEKALQLFPRHCRSEREVLQRLVASPGKYEKAFTAVHPRLRKLYLSAFQSFLFDQIVALRLERIDQLISGDLAFKHVNGACFLVEDAGLEQGRVAAFEISPSGPMFGCKMKQPDGEVRDLESELLNRVGVEPESFNMPGGLRMEGERRALRVPIGDIYWSVTGDVLSLEFTLPKGSYATSVIREITKTF